MIRGISDEPGSEAAAGTGQRSAWRSYAAATAAAFTRRAIEDLPTRKKAAVLRDVTDRATLNDLLIRVAEETKRLAVFCDVRQNPE